MPRRPVIRIIPQDERILEGVQPGQPLTLEQLYQSILLIPGGKEESFPEIAEPTGSQLEEIGHSAVAVKGLTIAVRLGNAPNTVIVRVY